MAYRSDLSYRPLMNHEPITIEVLRQMVEQRLQAAIDGEISEDYLRGYLTAMFHAGALTVEELQPMLQVAKRSD